MLTGVVRVVSSAPSAPVTGPARMTYGVRFTSSEDVGRVTSPVH